MCGITGFFSPSGPINCKNFYRSHLKIKHRGPDDEGFYAIAKTDGFEFHGDETIIEKRNNSHISELSQASLILGHRRLSIIDTSAAGHQPFCFEHLTMTYNGEIYNYQELRGELESLGYVFSTKSDSEVLLKAYHYWGDRVYSKLNGMWAFAIYNSHLNELTLSRDRLGIKPLFYHLQNNVICFGSEMKFIKSFASDDNSINKQFVKQYLRNSTVNNSQNTIWNSIKELEPGYFLKFRDGQKKIEQYWSPVVSVRRMSSDDALEMFSELFEDSLRLRMISDVDVGSLLSGGLDSTTIVSSLIGRDQIPRDKFKVYSAVFNDERFSEKIYIDDTVQQHGLHAHFTYPDISDFKNHSDSLFYHIEDPFRSLSVYSQYLIYKNIKENHDTKVLLNGQGSDELFGGYSYHYYPFFAHLIKNFQFSQFGREYSLWKDHRTTSHQKFAKQTLVYLLRNLFKTDTLGSVSINEITKTPLREYLKYDDRTSMAYGLEARVPFLDHRIVEFALNLGHEHKIKNFVNKKVLRDYAQGLIPHSILNRTDKQGFVSPQEVWQRNEMKPMLDKAFLELEEKLELQVLPDWNFGRIYNDYQSGQNNEWTKIWRIYNLKSWADYWLN